MAWKKTSSKGKGISMEAESSWMKPARSDLRLSIESMLRRVQWVMGTTSNEWGMTAMMPANKYKEAPATFCPIFLHTVFAGLVPPFSEFLLKVLEYYQI